MRYHHASGPCGQGAFGHRTRKRAEQPVRVSQEKLSDWPAFGVVCVEQSALGKATDNQAQLPPEIPRILDARVHTLCADGTVDVRRITSEKHVSFSIVCGLAMVEVKAREPYRIAEANRATGRWVNEGLHFGQ